ncbi:Glycyl-tRNA synthetase beta subunit [Alkalidesulfovibrio alkalitolerans DSM 16529]|uniref:Glycine--tRNA ligase beta subunit n=1 Tax=Alkalidesulfovibrio alkalitolerans DSM 16529 TaxID=1121439 RepID=S7U921_9BACT|nr:glycine--tRNA ligase subunit beta [Alkalidesulfovibrio alkalitolerans]EPR30439.1 Glycyl-tRNA synthetase beta subunit [Alkalidesulfovibrio alkalitolerans DSM 16529]
MPRFVLEIGVEEMPARFFPGLTEELQRVVAGELIAAKIDFDRIFAQGTPRRLVVQVLDAAEVQRSEEEIITGPPAKVAFDADGAPTKAGLGFARGQGVEPESLFTMDTDKGLYVACKKLTGGGRTIDILPAICRTAVASLSFPKKMRWGSREVGFGRPVRWLLALFGEDVVHFALEDIASSRKTWGHRVMGPGPFDVPSADAYESVLFNDCKVVLDPEERRRIVREEGERLAAEAGGRIVWNEALENEVVGLVEWPRPMLASFAERYLELPRQVLLTSMQSHQKSFGVEGADGKLMNRFLTVLNIEPVEPGLVRKGWERVLKARLEDARFFWEADTAAEVDAWLAKLDNVTFLAPLGSMGAKTRRIEALCGHLAAMAEPALAADLPRAGRLCKADLVSEMVYEFDSLQGIMGGIYLQRKGFSETIATAVAEHYLPAGPDTPVPASRAGALLSIADKMDTLCGCFGLNMIPTGGADQYALRRQALGVIRIVTEHSLRLDLDELISLGFAGYEGVAWKLSREEATAKLKEFFGQRLKAWFTGRGLETLVVEAALGAGFADMRELSARLAALSAFSASPGFDQAVLTFKRAANIIRKQGQEGGRVLSGIYDSALFESEAERTLAAAMEKAAPRFEELWKADDFEALFGLLAELRPAVDAFFDNVMVMCDDEALRTNRLNLLAALTGMLGRLADFSALQV